MKTALVQTTLWGIKSLNKIIDTEILCKNPHPLGSQIPQFENKPMSFCSYVCEGYTEIYGTREGIIFETDFSVVYACPVDTFDLLREGRWLPGHERFIFASVDEMLKKYPSSEHFKIDFQEYFRKLKPKEVYPKKSTSLAESRHRADYCLSSKWIPGCNEITFLKPTKIKNPIIFNSKEELEKILLK